MYKNYIKRPSLDYSILVKCKLGSPIIFKQERPGKDELVNILKKYISIIRMKGI